MYLDLYVGGYFDVCWPLHDSLPGTYIRLMLTIHRLLSAGLTDGGTAGLIWGFIGVCLGFTLVYASIAEMASM
jgi:hypothetical protein